MAVGALNPHSSRPGRLARQVAVLVAVALFVTCCAVLIDRLQVSQGQSAVRGTVNFAVRAHRTSAFAIGFNSSTYGATPLNSEAQARAERRLDARTIRIPVGVRDGIVVSSAVGAHATQIAPLVHRYLSWGYHVMVIIGGETNDVDVHPGDTTAIVSALGYDNGVEYSTPNEPSALGRSIEDCIGQARMILAEGRSLYPDFRVWGPEWAFYSRVDLRAFAGALGDGLAGADFHRYAMGSTRLTTRAAMMQTPSFGAEIRATAADLRRAGLSGGAAVDELNLSWRYADGPGGSGDSRFFSAVDTVWIASACGYVMLAGGTCLPYASQNGALGLTAEAGYQDPDGRPASSPMPAYWGVAAWTGARRFPHMTGYFYHTATASSHLEIFAVGNDRGGYNVVVINTGGVSKTISLRLRDIGTVSVRSYQTDPDHPYRQPVMRAVADEHDELDGVAPSMSVTTYVLQLDHSSQG